MRVERMAQTTKAVKPTLGAMPATLRKAFGISEITYAIEMKVVVPASTSVATVVPLAFRPKNRSMRYSSKGVKGSGLGFGVVAEAQVVEAPEDQAQDDGHHGAQRHAAELHRAELHGRAADAADEHYRGEDQVAGLGVVDLLFDEHADARGGDNAEEQDADAAHDGHGDAPDEGRQLAGEGHQDGDDGGAADDPHAVDLGDGHDADVLAVGGVGGGAHQARQHVGDAVAQQGAVQAGILHQVLAHDVPGHHQVAHMLRQHHQRRGQDDEDGLQVVGGRVERGHLEPGRQAHRLEVHHAEAEGDHVARDDAQQHGDHRQEPAQEDGGQDGHRQGGQRHHQGKPQGHAEHGGAGGEPGHVGGHGGQLQADDGHDGAHGSRREDDVDPPGARHAHHLGEQDEDEAEDDEAALGGGVAQPGRQHGEDG